MLGYSGEGMGGGVLSLNHTVENSPIKKRNGSFCRSSELSELSEDENLQKILKSLLSNYSNRSRWGKLHRVCFDQAIEAVYITLKHRIILRIAVIHRVTENFPPVTRMAEIQLTAPWDH